MNHTQYGVKHILTRLNENNKGSETIERWHGLDNQGKKDAMKYIKDYEELNERCINENLPTRHEVSLISREVGDSIVEGDLSFYDNGLSYEDNESYIAISNNEHSMKDISSLFSAYIGHKIRVKIEYLD